MDTPKWVERVNAATTTDEVVRIVNEYVESRDRAVLAILPVECQITPMRTADEISDCAYRLAVYHGHGDLTRTVQKLGAFFTRASVRIAEIAHESRTKQAGS